MRLSAWRTVAVLIVAIALLGLGVITALKPIRIFLSARYLLRGNTYFADQDYPEAVAQYAEALHYNPANTAAQTNQQEASVADVDIAQAKPFFQAHGVSQVLTTLQAAEGLFATPKAALVEGVSLYDQGEYVYAQYALLAATQMDTDYPEAWNYLGMTYQQLAKFDPSYTAKAQACFKKRDDLSPMYIK